jgi:hypothetical protein
MLCDDGGDDRDFVLTIDFDGTAVELAEPTDAANSCTPPGWISTRSRALEMCSTKCSSKPVTWRTGQQRSDRGARWRSAR